MNSKVAIIRTKPQGLESTIYHAVKQAIEALGEITNFCKPGGKILVKPNISSPNPMECTNPGVTWAVAKYFSDHSYDVYIGEDSAIPISEKAAYEEYGLYEIGEKAHAKIISLRTGEHILKTVPINGYFKEIEISQFALEVDLIISLAAMKTANITTVTLGTKNMKGVVRSGWKRKFHTEGLNHGIVDLVATIHPGLTIIDGTFAKDMAKKACYPIGLILAGTDPIATDSICARLMGFNPETIEHLYLADKAGIGTINTEHIQIVGTDFEELLHEFTNKFEFSSPKNPFTIAEKSHGKIQIIQGNPCCICLNELGNSLAKYENQLENLPEITIFIGPNINHADYGENRNKLFFGNCVKKHAKDGMFIGGCPPTEYEEAHTGSLIKEIDRLITLKGK